MSSLAVQSINCVNNQITVLFNQNWFQEDITTLRQLLLSNISTLRIKEIVIGADLENIRFQWRDTEYILNFDYYSQSCWFDTQYPQNLTETNDLFTLLNKNNDRYIL
jgi:hypothetical protein